ncbi:MAG TPA: hypothetical protein H9761_12610 [Candidatus Eisenbergiella merdavium]|uniref:Glycosyltransferase RgtA/B/C/D-like domain-containing protein n=1 Tax=Candidatus Eisenbergiella merdavium TaxID=2838551 RepID=A0A9D2NIG9_9FIRM|nr:hypothetical protein [Candidatus Eisenbergiella merdavium]
MTRVRSFFKDDFFCDLLFFALVLLCMMMFIFLQPFGEGPDEINRFRVVWYIAQNGTLPRGDDPAVLIPGYGGSYAFQPMLTYILQGYLLWFLRLFTDRFDVLLISARLVNAAFGLGAAFYARKLSKMLFPDRLSQWVFSCLAVFLPQSIFIHTYVNTDSCAIFSVMMMLTEALVGLRDGFRRPACIRLAAGIVLCALSYYNAYGAVLAAILLFISAFVREIPAGSILPDGTAFPKARLHIRLLPLLKKGLLISAFVAVGAGWWFLRNAVLYDGDFLGITARNICVIQTSMPDYHPLLRTTYQDMGVSILSMVFETDFFILLCRSFVAMFGPMSLPTHYYIYISYYWMFGIGLIAAAIPVGQGLYLTWLDRGHRFFTNFVMVLSCLIPIFLCVIYSYTWDFQPQGRYLLPMLPAFMYLITLGEKKVAHLLQALFDRLKLRALSSHISALTGGLVILFTIAALFYSVFLVMAPHYL